ncbi:MAG: hypothetical protein BCS36_11055 [Desulfovibrio sp. MES5]|uniref:sensor domain-containing diguanylate cyclase n=1 Tax=Desulfovibrio sp. MES5 TaxID=1899016 RepID=UPI000B9D211A|nr:GGDEF domain-containing protein [Desulfovibrio sp. MES5]OXS27862.1 MAG: hypothetical protein BCS36_11055 [Desulfovibrio sp. MES5]
MPTENATNIHKLIAEKPIPGTERKILLLVIGSTFLTALVTVFIFYRSLFYDLDDRLLGRSDAIFSMLLSRIPPQSITHLNTPGDADSEIYKRTQIVLEGLRKTTNVRYLYTVKRDAGGEPIYVVDGLSPDSEDFRPIGAPIEGEIIPIVARCLDGQSMRGEKAMDTSWGIIIPACEPIKQDGNTIGALVIEFDVQSFVNNTRRTALICLAFSFGVAILVTAVTAWLLKKISAPLYRKLAYTDLLTGVYNRNAFELDLRHMSAGDAEGLVILVCDLNRLKTINDRSGHAAGDAHIRVLAHLLRNQFMDLGKTYRIGGDEFTTLLRDITIESLEQQMLKLCSMAEKITIKGFQLTFSYGMAVFDPSVDDTVHSALNRADANMYLYKEKFKSQQILRGQM